MILLLAGACQLAADAVLEDVDEDGWQADEGDCDDADDDIHPGAWETCDRADNDCDGLVDEDACGNVDPDDLDFPSVLGEGELGRGILAGHFDGDVAGDALVTAMFGTEPALCLIRGARMTGLPDDRLGDVADCWLGPSPSAALVATRPPDGFGGAGALREVPWFFHRELGLCALDTASTAFTLEQATACVPVEQDDDEGEADEEREPDDEAGGALPFDGDVALAVADRDESLLAASSGRTAVVFDPAWYLTGGTGWYGWSVTAASSIRSLSGGDDVDGDGVPDLLVTTVDAVWVLSAHTMRSGVLEGLASTGVENWLEPVGAGAAGDVDGDGMPDWWFRDREAVYLLRGDASEHFSTIASPWDLATIGGAGVASAGDFDGDGRGDLYVRRSDGSTMLFLGSADVPAAQYAADAALHVTEIDGELGAAMARAVDDGGDGFDDLWMSAPSQDRGNGWVGQIYLLQGWALD